MIMKFTWMENQCFRDCTNPEKRICCDNTNLKNFAEGKKMNLKLT